MADHEDKIQRRGVNVKRFKNAVKQKLKNGCQEQRRETEKHSTVDEPASSSKQNINVEGNKGARKHRFALRLDKFGCKLNAHEVFEDLVEKILESSKGTRISLVGPIATFERLLRGICDYDKGPDLVHFLSFRDIPLSEPTTPCDLLFGDLPLDNPKDIVCGYKWLLNNQSNSVFIFDGLDKAARTLHEDAKEVGPFQKCRTSDIVYNIINKKLFPDLKIVYASSIAVLSNKLRPDMIIALAGISNGGIEGLFKLLVGDSGEELWENLITESYSLIPSLSNPTFLLFTTIVYGSKPKDPPKFFTGVMLELLEIFKRSGHVSENDLAKAMTALAKISFKPIGSQSLDRMVIFRDENFDNFDLILKQFRDRCITSPEQKRQNNIEILCLHPTIQDLLRSMHIATLGLDAFRKIVREQFETEYWSTVTKFLSGILLNSDSIAIQREVSHLEEKKKILRDLLAFEYKNTKEVTKKILLLESISESNDKEFIQSTICEIDIKNHPLSSTDMYAVSSVLRHCSQLKIIGFQNCNLDDTAGSVLWYNVKDHDIKVKEMNFRQNELCDETLYAIGHIIDNDGTLNIENCKHSRSDMNCLKASLGDKKLKVVTLKNSAKIGQSLDAVGQFIADGGFLDLYNCDITASELNGLKTGLTTKQLMGLNLAHNKQINQSLDVVGSIVSDRGSLNLWGCRMTAAGLSSLKIGLATKSLKELNLLFNKRIDQSLDTVGSCMANGGSLNLKLCDITDSGIEKLKAGLAENSLKELNIGDNMRIYHSFNLIGSFIADGGSLDLYNCNITATEIHSLESGLAGTSLSYLDVSSNHLTRADIDRINQTIKADRIDSSPQYWHNGVILTLADPYKLQ